MSYAKPVYDENHQLHLVPSPSHHGWGALKALAFGAVLVLSPRPMRRWIFTMLALAIAIVVTVQSPHEYWDGVGEYPDSYRFPWYCVALIVIFCVWGVFGYLRALRLGRLLAAAGDTPVERLKARMSSRVLIAVDNTQRPPQGPTGPSQRTTRPRSPKPAPSSPWSPPMGSNLPALYVPTYSGPAKPVRRIETGLSGTVVHDHRGVDPEDL